MGIQGDHLAHSQGGHRLQSASPSFGSFSVIGGQGEGEDKRRGGDKDGVREVCVVL